MSTQRLRIIVGGMVAHFPLGGVAWDYFHYVLALRELGHDVYYHEDTNTWPYNPELNQPSDDGKYNAKFIKDFFDTYAPDLAEKWHYRLLLNTPFGMSIEAFDEVCKTADVYLNVSGVCRLPDALGPQCKRVFMDTDPGYNQFGLFKALQQNGESDKRYIEVARDHNVHLTYAENIDSPDCLLPKVGIKWIPTRPTVTLSHWAEAAKKRVPDDAPFTTVMTLDMTKTPSKLTHDGRDYFDKRIEFERFIELPRRVPEIPLELAIGNNRGIEPVHANGWRVQGSGPISTNAATYQDFIAASRGEWSIAKNVYAATNSGWFSCRTACYLAAGRPAVVQDTMWSRYVPSGNGVFAFRTIEEAIDGLRAIQADYPRQQQAALDIAREYLAPRAVVTPMLERIFSNEPRP